MDYFLKKKKWMACLVLLTFLFTSIMPTNLAAGDSMAWAADEPAVSAGVSTQIGQPVITGSLTEADYPISGQEGHVRLEKSAEWIDKENGLAKITFSVSGTPVKTPVDTLLLMDRSTSMYYGPCGATITLGSWNRGYNNIDIPDDDAAWETYTQNGNQYRKITLENVTINVSAALVCSKNHSHGYATGNATCDVTITQRWRSYNSYGGYWGNTNYTYGTINTENVTDISYTTDVRDGDTCTRLIESAREDNGVADGQQRWEIAQVAATNFANIVMADNLDGTPTDNRMGLVHFAGTQNDDQYVTLAKVADGKSQSALVELIETVKPIGATGTSYATAFTGAVAASKDTDAEGNEIERTAASPELFVVFLTDGENNGGDYSSALASLKALPNVHIYAIGINADDYFSALQSIAYGDGYAMNVNTAAELNAVFTEIANQARTVSTQASIVDNVHADNFAITLKDNVEKVVASTGTTATVEGSKKVSWTIGDITETAKTLEIYITLDDSIVDPGLYDTNANDAVLTYTNHLNNVCTQKVASPSLPLNAGKIEVIYYEVDKDGKAITSVAAENFNFVRDITALKNYDFAYNDNTMLAKGTYVVSAEDTVKIGDKYYQFVAASVENSDNLNPNAGTYPVSVSVNESVHQVYFGYVEMDKLAYVANGGTGSMDPTEGYVGSAVTVSQNSFTRDKYIFVGWNTAADGSGTAYASGADYTLTSGDDVLYAQWEPLKPITITADSATKVYDGTALTKNSYTNTELAAGDSIESVTVTGSQTVVGKSDNVPSAAKIVNAKGEDVTASYDITYVNGTLEVTKRTV
ncbi:MAG: VWA domain-containing protein, partial [Peptococcaceae bacterium]|nr:VWA domain-containing protein [Peptococcaceae bacterium]